jgi:general secretion pathway protein B
MSYILDALRRADAERQQGRVPGIHATPAAGLAPAPGRRWVPGLGLLALGLLAGAVALLVWRMQPAPAAAPPAPPVPPLAQATSPASPEVAAPATALPALPVVVSAAPLPALDSGRAAPAAAPASGTAAVPPAVPTPQPASTSTPAAVRAVPLSSLPPDERRQLPALAPGGSVWSDSAASRFVILDGQVLREGDTVAPGLVLERIERKAALLRWRGQRLEVPL